MQMPVCIKTIPSRLLVATWLMHAGWQVFTPLLDAAHAVDLIASDGLNSYRLQIKSD